MGTPQTRGLPYSNLAQVTAANLAAPLNINNKTALALLSRMEREGIVGPILPKNKRRAFWMTPVRSWFSCARPSCTEAPGCRPRRSDLGCIIDGHH